MDAWVSQYWLLMIIHLFYIGYGCTYLAKCNGIDMYTFFNCYDAFIMDYANLIATKLMALFNYVHNNKLLRRLGDILMYSTY